MEKKVYSYSPETGEFLKEDVADSSPLEPGVWLYPSNSTQVTPPITQSRKIAVFNKEDSTWSVKDDFRNVQYWDEDGNPQKVTKIGEQPAANWSEQVPPPSISKAKAAKSQEIKFKCQETIFKGFTSTALGTPHNYPSDDKDQANLAASVLSSLYPLLPSDWTTMFLCQDEDGVWQFRHHNATQIQKVGADGKEFILNVRLKNEGLQNMISSALTVEEVNAITWDSL